MASEFPPVAVCDAGPLIHLDELGALPLLTIFAGALVPDAVWREVQRHRPSALRRKRVALEHRTRIPEASDDLLDLILKFALGLGEQEALRLMQSLPGAVLLTDDSVARKVAHDLGFDVHGTLGVILRAGRSGSRSRQQTLNLLRTIPVRSTLHLHRDLLTAAIREVRGGDS